jgi:hypothetical protein
MDFAEGIPSVIGQSMGYGEGKPINGSNHTCSVLQRWQNYLTFEVFFYAAAFVTEQIPEVKFRRGVSIMSDDESPCSHCWIYVLRFAGHHPGQRSHGVGLHWAVPQK